MSKSNHISRLFVPIALLLFSGIALLPVHASINVLNYWRMGEDDPGFLLNGSPATNLVDRTGARALVIQGAVTYSTDIAFTAAQHAESRLGISLPSTGGVAFTNVVTSVVDNFGLELWAKPTAFGGNQVIAYNGNTSTSGWGIILGANNTFQALLGGVVGFGTLPALPNAWAHLALVRSNGVSFLFVNGVPVSNNSAVPKAPAGKFAVGSDPQNLTAEFFKGLVDEARVFTFAPGQFSTNDLLYYTQIPTVATFPAASVTPTNAAISGTVNPNGLATTAWLQWGTNTDYGQVSALTNFSGTNLVYLLNADLKSLTIGGTYHFRTVATNILGTNYSADSVFTTPSFLAASAALTAVSEGSGAWGDFNNDGRLDLLYCGALTPQNPTTQLWQNNPDGTFTRNNTALLTDVSQGSLAWGDYDNDGRLDILLAGFDDNNIPVTEVWRNNGNGAFTQIGANLPGVFDCSVAWGDFDNDGHLDILLAGSTGPTFIAQVWHYDGDGRFSNINAGLPGVANCSVAWGDYNNDGWLDILIAGRTNGTSSVTQLWRNNGNGTFANINAGLTGVRDCGVSWGDFDNDGRLDILLAGTAAGSVPIAQIWHNNGDGTFLDINAGLTGVKNCAVAWGDYDNDGWLDLVLSGAAAAPQTFVTQVWRNNGNATFSDINTPFADISQSAVAWGDYDNDGKLDLLLMGVTTTGAARTQVRRNQMPATNSPPTAPSGLSASLSGSTLTFNWAAASDAETPAPALSYNLRVGTTPGGSDIVSPMAGTNGLRRLPQNGHSPARINVAGFQKNATFYWSVQAVDGAFRGSPFALENAFKLLPVMVATNAVSANTADTNGDGVYDQTELAAVLAHLKPGAAVDADNLDVSLRNYFAANPIVMSNVAGLGKTNVSLTLPNSPDANLNVIYSTDLTNWYSLGLAALRYTFTDTNAASGPPRFYRLVYP